MEVDEVLVEPVIYYHKRIQRRHTKEHGKVRRDFIASGARGACPRPGSPHHLGPSARFHSKIMWWDSRGGCVSQCRKSIIPEFKLHARNKYGNAISAMGVVTAVLTIVTLALLGVAGYVLVVVLSLRLRDPILRQIEASEMPPGIRDLLRPLMEEMREAGLSFVALQHTRRPAGDSIWGAVCCDSSGTTWALAQFDRTLFTVEHRINLAFYSRLASGMVIVTARKPPVSFVMPRTWRMTQGEFEAVSSQWMAHQETIDTYGGGKNVERIANYEEFREWHQNEAEHELDTLWEKGLVSRDDQGAFRFELSKLHHPVWHGLVEVARFVHANAVPWMRLAQTKTVRIVRLARAVPWIRLAQTKALESFRVAKATAMAWKAKWERARHPESAEAPSTTDGLCAAVHSRSSSLSSPVVEVVAPAPPPGEMSQAPAKLPVAPARETPAVPPGTAAELDPPVVPAPAGPLAQTEFTTRLPVQQGLVASPSRRKSRLELYREAQSRFSLPGCLGWSFQGMLQCAALAVFVLALFSWRLTDVTTLWVIGTVLVLHEVGHAIVMRISGFRHRALFFLPVIGWLAAGRRTCVSPRREFWIHVMGPLPGLVAGWGILIWNFFEPGRPEWLLDGAFWAVLLNTFFLLPFNPLDGGRIADLIFFNRHPNLRVMFYLGAGVALGALYFLSPVLLVMPFVVLAQIPEGLRARRLSRAVRRAVHPAGSEESALLRVFKLVEDTGNEKLYKRFGWPATIDRLLRVAASQRLGFGRRLCGAGVHLALLLSPLIVLVAYGVTLRAEHDRALAEASGRIDVLEKQVRWIGVPSDNANRRILKQIQAAEQSRTPGWEDLKRVFGDDGVGGDLNGDGTPAPGVRSEVVALARQLDWNQVGAWIVEDEEEARSRRSVITGAVSALIDVARSSFASEDYEAVERDLAIAYWAIVSCEPRRSFKEWRKWSMLESEVLVILEELAADRHLSRETGAWFSKALSQGPRPDGRKLALLLLRDLTDGMVSSWDVYGGPELMGWGRKAGNPVWDPDPAATRAEVAASVRAPLEKLGVQKPGVRPNPSHRVRFADATHHYVTSAMSGERLRDSFRVADQWSRQDEATPCQAVLGDDLRVIESWNRRLRPILRVNSYRELAAAGLAASNHAPLPQRTSAGPPITMEQGANGRWLVPAVPERDGGGGPGTLAWRLPRENGELGGLATE